MRRIPLAALAALLLVPASAPAATRLASPTGATTGDCLAAACSLDRAIEVAATGDTVELASGTYTRTTPVVVDKPIVVEGDPAEARPTLDVSVVHAAVQVSGGGLVRHVDIEAESPDTCCYRAAVSLDAGTLERATVTGGENTGYGVMVNDGGGTVRDSIVINTADDLVVDGVAAFGPTLVEGSTIVSDYGLNTGTYDAIAITLRNTIVQGGTADWVWYGIGDQTTVNLVQTRLSTKQAKDGGPEPSGQRTGVITAAADLTADGHQNAGSPTIDAGTTQGIAPGARDIDGEGRVYGTTQDIGADERPGALWIGRPHLVKNGSQGALVGVTVNAIGSDVRVTLNYPPSGYTPTLPAGPDLFPPFQIYTTPGQERTVSASAEQDNVNTPAPGDLTFTALALPETTGPTGPSATGDARPTFTFASDLPDTTFMCAIAGRVTQQACTSPWQVPTDLPSGSYTLSVRAIDWSGGVEPTPATKSFTVNRPQTTTTTTTTTTTDTPAGDTPPPAQPLPTSPIVPPVEQVRMLAPRVGRPAFRDRRLRVRVTNPNASAATIAGKVVAKRKTLAKGSVRLGPNAAGTLILKLTKAGRRAAKRKLRGTLTVSIGAARTTKRLR